MAVDQSFNPNTNPNSNLIALSIRFQLRLLLFWIALIERWTDLIEGWIEGIGALEDEEQDR
jgi:hypothetical protein